MRRLVIKLFIETFLDTSKCFPNDGLVVAAATISP